MNRAKRSYAFYYSIISLACSCLLGFFYPMLNSSQFSSKVLQSIQADMKVFFLPESQNYASEYINALLAFADNQILIAMYNLTHRPLIDKLITLKNNNKNLDIDVLLDELSVKKSLYLASLLEKNNIPITIFPSSVNNSHMHNKFLIIDGEITLTGSANFSQPVLNIHSKYHNYENIISIKSSKIGSLFAHEFFALKNKALDLYLKPIKEHTFLQPPYNNAFFKEIITFTYNTNLLFAEKVNNLIKEKSAIQANEIKQFLGIIEPEENLRKALKRKRLESIKTYLIQPAKRQKIAQNTIDLSQSNKIIEKEAVLPLSYATTQASTQVNSQEAATMLNKAQAKLGIKSALPLKASTLIYRSQKDPVPSSSVNP